MSLQIVTPPPVDPVSLAEAKAHLRVDHNQDDALITMLIKAATSHIDGKDGYLGRALVQQTWDLVFDDFPDPPFGEVKIPLPPLQEVLSINYVDSSGFDQTLDASEYTVDNVSEPGWVVPVTTGWPISSFDAINAIRIRFVAGYPATADSPEDLASNVPFAIKAAILLHVGSLYEHRETVVIGQSAVELPWGALQLLNPFRVLLSMA